VTTLAIDLGGTRIKVGVIADGVVVARDILAAHSQDKMSAQLDTIAGILREHCERLRVDRTAVHGVVVGFPGLVDDAGQHVTATYGKYDDARSIDFIAWARRHFGVPALLENDVRIALLGERTHGAGRGCDDLVMVTLGTGFGAVAMIAGKLLRGRHGQAGVLGGHFTVNVNGRLCSCGNIGCAEAEASTAYLPAIARAQPAFSASALASEPSLSYAAVFHHAAAGDASAMAIRDHSLKVWGAQIVSLIHAYDPARVIIGGGVMASAAAILPFLQGYVRRHAHTPWGVVDIVAAQLGDDLGLLGCDALARQRWQSVALKT
jgi:glucokinase